MKNLTLILFYLLMNLSFSALGNSEVLDLYNYDYSLLDAEVRSKASTYCKTTNDVSKYIVSVYPTPHERLRATWIWVTENIKYDVDIYNIANYRADVEPSVVMKSRKTVCSGYSKLMKAILDITDPYLCQEVSGYAKTKHLSLEGHAWNIININGYYFLLDATWGAGHVKDKEIDFTTGKKKVIKEFVKQYDEFWFLTPPSYFAVSHFTSTQWKQLLVHPISLELFKETPYVSQHYFMNELSNKYLNTEYESIIIDDDIKVYTPINLQSEWLFFHSFFTQASIIRPRENQQARLHFYSKNYYQEIKVNDRFIKPVVIKRMIGYDYYISYLFHKNEVITIQDSWNLSVKIKN